MLTAEKRLTRIGVFYDGIFLHVSNYYLYQHTRKARLAITGIHNYMKKKVSEYEGVDERFRQIVDAHYFRGRCHNERLLSNKFPSRSLTSNQQNSSHSVFEFAIFSI